MLICADCQKMACEKNDFSLSPKGCPCIDPDRDEMTQYYKGEDLRVAQAAGMTEKDGYRELTRVEETMQFAARLGYKRLGLAFCMGFRNEARVFVKILRANGFEVESVGCKNCGFDKSLLGADSDYKMREEGQFEPMCNPIGQAKYLDGAGTELNIVMGLCVGHDSLFIKNTETLSTVIAVKDRVLGHNPMAAIYNAESYRRDLFHFMEGKEYKVIE